MSSRSRARTALLCAALLLPIPASVVAQQPDSSPVAEAVRRRNTRDFAGAADLLSAYAAEHPEDAQAARLLGETLYWLQQPGAARSVYEAALLRHGGDDELRLTYGRMLVETLDARRARAILSPLIGRSRGRAESLLGTSAYWSGDYTRAQRLFVEALRADSTLASVRLQLYEIAAVTAPRLRLEPAIAQDDQPLRRLGLTVRGEYFLMPPTKMFLRIEPRRYSSGDSIVRVLTIAEGGVSRYAPRARVETELVAGSIARRSTEAPVEWTGRLALGFRLPRHLVFRVRAEREPYLYTLASLTTPIMMRAGGALLEWKDPRGWLGEAAAQRQWYPDANTVTAVYLWFLAPMAKTRSGDLQAGYAAAAHHAYESRFVLARPRQQFQPSDPRFDMRGRYSPYHTPYHLVTHSVLLGATVRLGPTSTLRTNASFGVLAWDEAPFFYATTGGPPGLSSVARATYRRRFNPVSVRGGLDVASTNDWIMTITGDYQRSPFYSVSTAGLRLTHRFTRAAVRRVDRY